MIDEDNTNFPSRPFCSPTFLLTNEFVFTSRPHSDLGSENMSFTSSCEFSLQLDPNILDDFQSDSDATCMPNNSQYYDFKNNMEPVATSFEKQKHYSTDISQDLFAIINSKNSLENEIGPTRSICASNTSAEEEENMDASSSSSKFSLSENLLTPCTQDLHFHEIERKLAWLNKKLKSAPTISRLRELKTCVGNIFGKLMKINDSQHMEKQQLSKSQVLGSRLAKRSTKLKRFIDMSDELDSEINKMMQFIEPINMQCKNHSLETTGEEEILINCQIEETTITTVAIEHNYANDALQITEEEIILNDETNCQVEETTADVAIELEPVDALCENHGFETTEEDILNDETNYQVEETIAAVVIETPRAASAAMSYPGDLSPVLSLRADGTLYDKTGEQFSTVSHWLQLQQRKNSSETVGQVSSGKSQPSSDNRKSIFELLNFDRTLNLAMQLKRCKIVLTNDDEILPQAYYLPQNFWSNDFSKVVLNHALVQAIDRW